MRKISLGQRISCEVAALLLHKYLELLLEASFGSPQSIPEQPGITTVAEGGGLKAVLTVGISLCPIGSVMERFSSLGNVLDVIVNQLKNRSQREAEKGVREPYG